MMEKTGLQNEEELTKQYPQQVAAINAAADARQNRMIPALEQEIALSQQWSTGWNNAFATFQDSAHNNATAAASVFNTMTSSMQSTLLNFFNTGKMGWKSFASAILVECERIMVAKMAAGLLSSTTSFFTGGGTASTAGGISASSSGLQLPRFRHILTDFKLANGGASGGWRAVLREWRRVQQSDDVFPLWRPWRLRRSWARGCDAADRGSDGKLGVRASGGSWRRNSHHSAEFLPATGWNNHADRRCWPAQWHHTADVHCNAEYCNSAILQQMQPGGSIARLYGTKQ
jgi:phage-related minor tail protein